MSLSLQIERHAGQALHAQIAGQIRERIEDGRLQPGQQLPTVRDLADEVGVTRLTVHKAFRLLQSDGWLEATVGRGTFVRQRSAVHEWPRSGRRLTADRVMADIQQYSADVSMRMFAHAEPDPELLPASRFWDCLLEQRHEAGEHLRYGSPQGDPELRREAAGLLDGRGILATSDDILITSGVTQGLSLVAQALAQPGDRVAVEVPTYLGLLHILEAQGLRPVGIPLDDEGPRLDVLDQVVAQDRPRFFYTIATFHNPTGVSMSPRRRDELMELAERHGLFIVEDDVYHRLAYDAPPPPALRSMDPGGRVIYLDGISKAALPGVRPGFVLAPQPLLDRLVSLRRAADLCGPLPMQRALARFIGKGFLKEHLEEVVPVYRRRRDAMLAALEREMPQEVTWRRPEGGFSCWLTLPHQEAFTDLYLGALEQGLVVAPGEVFLVSPGPKLHLRLCFGNQTENAIREGVAILAAVIKQRLTRRGATSRSVTDGAPLV